VIRCGSTRWTLVPCSHPYEEELDLTSIPYQVNDGGIVALLPDGRVEFLHPAIRPILDGDNRADTGARDIDYDDYILSDPLVDLENFHLSAPAIAFIEVTNLCNLRCKHCYANSGLKRESEMATSTISRLIDDFDQMGVLQVFLTGGEVFSHPDALEIICHARAKRFSTQIFTNGLLLTPHKLRQLPAGTSFFISFDTADPVRTIRGKMDFPKLQRCFESMLEFGHVLRTAISVHRFNINDAEEIFEWCAKRGYPRPQWLETHPIGRALLHPDILLQPHQVDKVFEVYKRCMERYTVDENTTLPLAGFEDKAADHVRSIDTIKFCQRLERATGREKCGRSFAYVNSSGDVFPCSNCMSSNMFRAGNVTETSFESIWRDGFAEVRRITFKDFKVCSSCPIEQENIWCQFRCPPLAQNVSGDPLACGATEYLRLFMLKAGRYWEERRRRNIRLVMQPVTITNRTD
jgi:radical SAM protein with 4Fe4S-binding SPASM domain